MIKRRSLDFSFAMKKIKTKKKKKLPKTKPPNKKQKPQEDKFWLKKTKIKEDLRLKTTL